MAVGTILLYPGAAISDPVDEAIAAAKAGDYSLAYSIARPLAEHGSAKAQALLGFLFESGEGVAVDMEQAVHWYRLAAEQGDAGGQTNLCAAYIRGDTGRRDPAEGLRWCMLGAEQGNHVAHFNLPLGYYRGEGLPKDLVQSYVRARLADWYAADNSSKIFYKQFLAELWGQMSGEQIVEGDRPVEQWKQTHP